MWKCKAKAIQVDLDIFAHTLANSEIFRHIQAYSEPCAILEYPERWHIQN